LNFTGNQKVIIKYCVKMKRFNNILLVLEDTHLAGASALRAVELTRINNARLTIVDVLPSNPLGISLQSFSEKMEKAHEKMMSERKQELEEILHGYLQDVDAKIEVLSGKPFLEIIKFVQQNDCDLVIKSAEEEKIFHSILFGSTDLKLLRKCPCPVWIVKPDERTSSRKILAAIGLESFYEESQIDQLSRQIVEIATSLGYRESAEVFLVNAYMIFDGGKLAKKLSKHFDEDSSSWVAEQKKNAQAAQAGFQRYFEEYIRQQQLTDLQYNFQFSEGQAEDVIVGLAESEEVDLIVMGTVGRSDLAGFFVGNTSEAVLNRINCSVLAVKPPGFMSPVMVENH